MDTRSKILTLARARAISERPLVLVIGTFDVLRLEHARAFERERDRTGAALLAAVLPRSGELLAQRARAELVAALASVKYVVPATPTEVEELVQALHPASVSHWEDADEQRVAALRDHILARTRNATME